MKERELNRLLGELEQELARNPDLDEGERAALDELRKRIGHVLEEQEEPTTTVEPGQAEPLSSYVDRFETTHPTFTMILGRIADALNKMGI
jgi:hypothetical protein